MDPKHRDRIAFFRVCSGRFTPGHEGAAPAREARDEARQRAHVHGQRARRSRGRRGRRHHRHPQPRPAADRRHAHRGRGARRSRAFPTSRPELFRVARPRDPLKGKQLAEGPAGAGRGRRDPGVRGGLRQRDAAGRGRAAAVRDRRAPAGDASTRWTRSTTTPPSPPRAGSRIPTRACGGSSSASSRRRSPPTSTAIPSSWPRNKYNLQVTMERWPKVGFRSTREHREVVTA